jgi:hypothetical protein
MALTGVASWPISLSARSARGVVVAGGVRYAVAVRSVRGFVNPGETVAETRERTAMTERPTVPRGGW